MKQFPKNLILVRHAEAEINVSRAKAQRLRPQPLKFSKIKNEKSPLTGKGKKHAKATGIALRKKFKSFDVIFVSPYFRAKQTADIVKKVVSCKKVITDKRLGERSKGILELYTHYGVRTKFPKEYRRRMTKGPYYYRPPKGENFEDVQVRINRVVNDLLKLSNKNVLVVTHGVGIACIMDFFEHFPINRLMKINDHVRLCSVTCYSLSKNGVFKRRFYDKIYY